jgi:hypothetical protein
VPRHVARLVTRIVAWLVVDYSASCRLSVDYFASAALRVPRQVARLVTRLVAPLIVDYSTSRRLVVDYFSSAALLMVNSCIKVHSDLQADKSPIVVKGPFFHQVVNPRYRIRRTMCNARNHSSKER